METFFVSDLHGRMARFQELFRQIESRKPGLVFIGGDFLPSAAKWMASHPQVLDFGEGFLIKEMRALRDRMGSAYPTVILIPGNDDVRAEIDHLAGPVSDGLYRILVQDWIDWEGFRIFGYPYVPPTPFLLKDWEKFDVSRFVDPGCLEPGEGTRSRPAPYDTEFSTIRDDLDAFKPAMEGHSCIFLFHSPPYQTRLDRAALDGKRFDHVPLDVHVGSIAIRRFIEETQPLLCLHGHVHESARLTGAWRDQIGQSLLLNAASEDPGLSLISLDPENPGLARRVIHPCPD